MMETAAALESLGKLTLRAIRRDQFEPVHGRRLPEELYTRGLGWIFDHGAFDDITKTVDKRSCRRGEVGHEKPDMVQWKHWFDISRI